MKKIFSSINKRRQNKRRKLQKKRKNPSMRTLLNDYREGGLNDDQKRIVKDWAMHNRIDLVNFFDEVDGYDQLDEHGLRWHTHLDWDFVQDDFDDWMDDTIEDSVFDHVFGDDHRNPTTIMREKHDFRDCPFRTRTACEANNKGSFCNKNHAGAWRTKNKQEKKKKEEKEEKSDAPVVHLQGKSDDVVQFTLDSMTLIFELFKNMCKHSAFSKLCKDSSDYMDLKSEVDNIKWFVSFITLFLGGALVYFYFTMETGYVLFCFCCSLLYSFLLFYYVQRRSSMLSSKRGKNLTRIQVMETMATVLQETLKADRTKLQAFGIDDIDGFITFIPAAMLAVNATHLIAPVIAVLGMAHYKGASKILKWFCLGSILAFVVQHIYRAFNKKYRSESYRPKSEKCPVPLKHPVVALIRNDDKKCMGTGVIANGVLVTAQHVMEDAKEITLTALSEEGDVVSECEIKIPVVDLKQTNTDQVAFKLPEGLVASHPSFKKQCKIGDPRTNMNGVVVIKFDNILNPTKLEAENGFVSDIDDKSIGYQVTTKQGDSGTAVLGMYGALVGTHSGDYGAHNQCFRILSGNPLNA
jgi:phosphatidylglycerophosphate synthase